MSNNSTVENEAIKLINDVKDFWGSMVSEIKVSDITDRPFDMFTLTMKLYEKYDVVMEYDRSTLSINTKIKEQFIVLSRLANEPVFRGFEGYKPENLLHNFKVLDKTLKDMDEQD